MEYITRLIYYSVCVFISITVCTPEKGNVQRNYYVCLDGIEPVPV